METDPHSISTFHHGEALVKYTHCVREGDSVYPQQSLLVSTASFQAEQDPTQSNLPTNIPYYAAVSQGWLSRLVMHSVIDITLS